MKNVAFVIRDSISTLTASYLCLQEVTSSIFFEAFGVDPNTPGRSGFICRTCKEALHKWKRNRKPAHQVGLGSDMVPKLNFVVLSLSVLNISVPFF